MQRKVSVAASQARKSASGGSSVTGQAKAPPRDPAKTTAKTTLDQEPPETAKGAAALPMTNRRSVTRRLTLLYTASLVSIAGLSVAGQVLIQRSLAEQELDVQAIATAQKAQIVLPQASRYLMMVQFSNNAGDRQTNTTQLNKLLSSLSAAETDLKALAQNQNLSPERRLQVKDIATALEPINQLLNTTAKTLVSGSSGNGSAAEMAGQSAPQPPSAPRSAPQSTPQRAANSLLINQFINQFNGSGGPPGQGRPPGQGGPPPDRGNNPQGSNPQGNNPQGQPPARPGAIGGPGPGQAQQPLGQPGLPPGQSTQPGPIGSSPQGSIGQPPLGQPRPMGAGPPGAQGPMGTGSPGQYPPGQYPPGQTGTGQSGQSGLPVPGQGPGQGQGQGNPGGNQPMPSQATPGSAGPIGSPPGPDNSRNTGLSPALQALQDDFMRQVDEFTLNYTDQVAIGVRGLKTTEMALFATTLLVLVLEGLWVFRPAVQKINDSLTALEKSLKQTQETAKYLSRERQKSEKLLLNILPRPVANRLKKKQEAIADGFAEVTVLFADIVGFTKLSTTMPPQKLVALLNHIFSAFDELAEKHGLEKIKTIGDAYMVVGGLPNPRPDHATAIVAMAIDMQKALLKINHQTGESFSIRIGINTGPVVAGVIGIKKFIYDLWGDTVNTASRMESHGQPGAIQITESTYQLIKDRYRAKSQGKMMIKGKGEMETYLVTSGATDSPIA